MSDGSSLIVSARVAPDAPTVSWEVNLTPAFLDTYEMGKLLGVGGMGSVYSAVQRSTGRPVALKFMKHVGHEEATQRFLREGRVMAKISHAGVLRVYDVGLVDRTLYLVTELHTGGTLRELNEERGRWDAARAAELVATICEALEACHAAGVVHRDLKPGNILIRADGEAILADFGLARTLTDEQLTLAGALIGTPMYMSPEQIVGQPVTPAADLYAVGAILFELIVGQPPRRMAGGGGWDGSAEALAALAPDAPPRLRTALLMALAPEPAQRPASAAEFALSLRAAVAPERRTRPAAIAGTLARDGARAGDGRARGDADGGDGRASRGLSAGQRGARPFVAVAVACALIGVLGWAALRRTSHVENASGGGAPVSPPAPEERSPLAELRALRPLDPPAWLARRIPPGAIRDRSVAASVRILTVCGLHGPLERLLERPERYADAEGWAAAGWVELVERTLGFLRLPWPYRTSFTAEMAKRWPSTPEIAPVDESWETHLRGTTAEDKSDLRFLEVRDVVKLRRIWCGYPVRLERRPRAARVWLGMITAKTNHVFLVRFGREIAVVTPPAQGNPLATRMILKPASAVGSEGWVSRDSGVEIMFDGLPHVPVYLGREIPASWLAAGENRMEVTSALLDGTDAAETGPAMFVKALSVK